MVPEVMVVSRRARKEVARAYFWAEKVLRWVRSSAGVGVGEVERLVGDVVVVLVDFRGEVVGKSSSLSEEESDKRPWSSRSSHFCFLGERSGFEGEKASWWLLTSSAFQKASRLGRWFGAVGMWTRVLEGETSFDEVGGANGGVRGRDTGGAFRGERCLVGVGILRWLVMRIET